MTQQTDQTDSIDRPAHPPRPFQVGDMINPFSQLYGTPWLSMIVLGMIIAIFVGMLLYRFIAWPADSTGQLGVFDIPGAMAYLFGATWGPDIIDNGQVWRLGSAMFLHANLAHILFNGYALYILGRDVERLFGTDRFALVYVISGLFGGVVSLAWHGYGEFSVGASGAIFGLFGMQLAFFTYYRDKLGQYGQERFSSMIRVIGLNVFLGLVIVQVNNAAHMGGLVAGFLMGYLFTPRYFVTRIVSPGLVYEPGQGMEITDYGSLRNRWYGVLLSAVILLASGAAVIYFYRTTGFGL